MHSAPAQTPAPQAEPLRAEPLELLQAEPLQAYYAARAAEYEQVYAKPERQAELRALEAALPGLFAGRRVLELACGTGWWTLHGARDANFWLATDLNRETTAIARAKPQPAVVRFATVDALTLAELGPQAVGGGFDAAFAGFWWSHVPRAQLGAWRDTWLARLAPGARVLLLDNRYVPGSSTPLSAADAAGDTWQQRRLADGSTHRVRKNFPHEGELEAWAAPWARDWRWHDGALGLVHYWAFEFTVGARH